MDDYMKEFDSFLNEPPQYENQRMVRDYRHEAYPKWKLVMEEILRLREQCEVMDTDDALITSLRAEIEALKLDGATSGTVITLGDRRVAVSTFVAAEIERMRAAMEWRPISGAPYLGEPFLAAGPIYSAHTEEFLHWEYAILYSDEGRLHFYGDDFDPGLEPDDYTLFLAFAVPEKPRAKAALSPHPSSTQETK